MRQQYGHRGSKSRSDSVYIQTHLNDPKYFSVRFPQWRTFIIDREPPSNVTWLLNPTWNEIRRSVTRICVTEIRRKKQNARHNHLFPRDVTCRLGRAQWGVTSALDILDFDEIQFLGIACWCEEVIKGQGKLENELKTAVKCYTQTGHE